MGNTERIEELLDLKPELKAEVAEAVETASGCQTMEEVAAARVGLLGKKGVVSRILKGLKDAGPEERPVLGELGNLLRSEVEARLDSRREQLEREESERELRGNAIDVTLPGRMGNSGRPHLLTQVIEEVVDIFVGLGYRVEEGPEAELDYYNFEALNTPPFHPARSLQDTFYIRRGDRVRDSRTDVLLRTHTSPVQVRVMETESPPLYVVSPGKAYRVDEIDATHSAMFFQVEGFAVDRGLNMGHLKGTLEAFARRLFGEDRGVRLRPHFFPFTEPSAEVDVSCFVCDAKGCSLCKGGGWLEIIGCGMIDPNVLGYVGYDPEEFSGFAFGMGIERIAMMRHGIDDMRVFYENDLRFLSQF